MSVKKTSQPVAISDGLPVAEYIFSENKKQVAALLFEGEPWFIGKDICGALELADTETALRKLDDDEKLLRKVYVSGQDREVWLVNESGLYSLIFRSTKPSAKAFRRWVTQEVLPEIRKNGRFEGVKNTHLPTNAVLFAGLKMVKINGIRFFPYREVARRLEPDITEASRHNRYMKGRGLEPECFLNIDGTSMVSEPWVDRYIKHMDLRMRRAALKKGGAL